MAADPTLDLDLAAVTDEVAGDVAELVDLLGGEVDPLGLGAGAAVGEEFGCPPAGAIAGTGPGGVTGRLERGGVGVGVAVPRGLPARCGFRRARYRWTGRTRPGSRRRAGLS